VDHAALKKIDSLGSARLKQALAAANSLRDRYFGL
jgi:hypothetical protein